MGTFFPDDDEYPDHRPLPARLAHVSRRVAYWLVAALSAAWNLRPGSGAEPDPPEQEVYQF
jgi:hypothetical protein